MSTRADFALKAFDFKRRMEAEGMSLSPAYDHLLKACCVLGDIPRARKVVAEMQHERIPLTPHTYHHLIGMFASAMQLPKATDFERVAHLQYAWNILSLETADNSHMNNHSGIYCIVRENCHYTNKFFEVVGAPLTTPPSL